MERVSLIVHKRAELKTSSVGRLRKEKCIPAIIYGKKFKPMNIKIDNANALILKKIGFSENTLIDLAVQGEHQKIAVLIKDIQYHAVSDEVIHIDFIHVSLTEKIKVKVPIKVKGIAAGIKDGGMLQYVLRELEIECIPTEIPDSIEVDVTALKLGDAIHVKEIPVPASAKVITPGTDVIISVVKPEEEKPEEAAAAEGAVTEPEVIKEKPKTEEAEAGAEASKKDDKKAEKKKDEKKEEKKEDKKK